MIRAVAVAVAVTLLATSCAKPPRQPATTLDSPTDIEVLHVCQRGTVAAPMLDAWTPDCATTQIAYALVANSGNRFVHVVRADARDPYYIDMDRAIPGVTGIVVPDGPTAVEGLSHPTMAVVASHRERAFLSVIEVGSGTRASLSLGGADVGTQVELREPVGALVAVVPESEGSGDAALEGSGEETEVGPTPYSVVVATLPMSRTLQLWTVEAACGAPDVWTPGCTPTAAFSPAGTIALPGVPLDIVVRPDGRAWVALDGSPGLYSLRLFGTPDPAEACAEPPCLGSPMPVTDSCSDGLDDDGDGLVDADDPQCFGAGGEESGRWSGATPTACTNGVDDDGDGATDADDPGCEDDGDQSEDDAYDPPDGSGAAPFPSQDAFVVPTDARCSNHEDDDGDGRIDWPADTDCYGPNDDGETAPVLPQVADLDLTAEGDLLIVLERRSGQLLFYDADTDALLRADEMNPARTRYGATVFGAFPGPIVADTQTFTEEFGTPLVVGDTTYTWLRIVERRVHVATTSGFGETVVIDAALSLYTGHPDAAGSTGTVPVVDEFFVPLDLNSRSVAAVTGISCSRPFDATGIGATADCDEPPFPAPARLPDGEAGSPIVDDCGVPVAYPETNPPYTSADVDPGFFATLSPTIVRHFVSRTDCVEPRTEAIVERTVPDDYAIDSGSWDVVFEGVITGTERVGGLLVGTNDDGTRGRLEFPDEDPCATRTFCSDRVLDRDACPELAELCDSGGGSDALCDQGVDVCLLCPSACRGADFCAAGVLPGDIVQIERFEVLPADGSLREQCQPFGVAPDAEEIPLAMEYEVCSVAGASLEIAPFATGCAEPTDRPGTVTTVPDEGCDLEPVEIRVRANGWLVRAGNRIGPSPYVERNGRCVLHPDAAQRLMRVELDQPFSSDGGPGFTLESRLDGLTDAQRALPAYELYPRDFTISFAVSRNYTLRTDRVRQLLLGPATSAMAVVESSRDRRRILAVDEAQSYMWLFNAKTYSDEAVLP